VSLNFTTRSAKNSWQSGSNDYASDAPRQGVPTEAPSPDPPPSMSLKSIVPESFKIRVRDLRRQYHDYQSFKRLAAKYRNADVIVLKDRNAGFFSIYFQAICAYRIAKFNRQKVIFQFDTGPYWDLSRSEISWWDYYFECNHHAIDGQTPLKNSKKIRIESLEDQHELALMGAGFAISIANELILQNRLKAELAAKIRGFKKKEFKDDFIIALHYRGTDKVSGDLCESARVDYSAIGVMLDELAGFRFPFRLFIATDEQRFLDYVKSRNDLDICFTDSLGSVSGQPLHMNDAPTPGYELGVEALMDAILLSEADFLVRTDSNLSLASLFFNPLLDSINLSNADLDPASIGGRITSAYARKNALPN